MDGNQSTAPSPSSNSSQPVNETDNTAITITLAVEEINLTSYRPLLAQFHAQNNDIRVNLVSIAEVIDSNEPDPVAALAAAADVFPYYPDRQNSQQYLLDLQPLIAVDSSFDRNDFLPGLLPDDGSVWSLPVAASYPLVFFDKAAFDAADLAYPEPGWTLDEFLTAAQALTTGDGDSVTKWGYVPLRVQPLLAAQLNGPLLTPDGTPRLTDPDVADAVRWLADLFSLHQVAPLPQAAGGPAPLTLLNAGQAAMWSGDHVLWQFEENDNLGLTTIPHGQRGYAADATRYAFAASQGTIQPQAAWRLLSFLSRQPPVSGTLDLLVPARRSVVAATGFWNEIPTELANPLRYAVDNNAAPHLTPATAEALMSALTAVLTENESVTAALEQVQADAAGLEAMADNDVESMVVVPTESDETQSGQVHITFVTEWSLAERHQILAKENFEQDYPDIRIKIERRDDAWEHGPLLNRVAAGDCFLAPVSAINDELQQAVIPIGPLLELDTSLQPDDFYPAMLQVATVNGVIWGLPAWVRMPYLQYNRDLFAAANVSEPSLDWTLDNFLYTVQALTSGEGDNKQYGYMEWTTFMIRFGDEQFGVDFVSDEEAVPLFDFDAATEMVQWYADLVQLYQVQPLLSSTQGDTEGIEMYKTLMIENRLAMWPDYALQIFDFSPAAGFDPDDLDLGAAPFPIGPAGGRVNLAGDSHAYFIMADTDARQRQACWQWLTFLATQPTATKWFPAHMATAASAAYANEVGPEVAAVYRASVESEFNRSTTTALPPWMDPGYQWLLMAYLETAGGNTNVATALSDADAKFNSYHQCVITNEAFTDYARWRTCAIDVDPQLINYYGEPIK